MKQKAPISVGSANRGLIRTAEAARVLNSSMWLKAANRKEIHSDLPQLHDRNGEGRKGPEWSAAVQVPEMGRASTSHVERKNGTLRQWCKRLTRLTYAFSKKWDNLKAALALHFAHYNFCRIHSTTRVTPAMAAGIADHVWTLDELISL